MKSCAKSKTARIVLSTIQRTLGAGLILALMGCGTTVPVDAEAVNKIVGNDLPGVKGKTPEDQRRINRTMAGLCGAKVYDRATCEYHGRQVLLPYPASASHNPVAALMAVAGKGGLQSHRSAAKVPFAIPSSFARPRTSAVLDSLRDPPKYGSRSLRGQNTR